MTRLFFVKAATQSGP